MHWVSPGPAPPVWSVPCRFREMFHWTWGTTSAWATFSSPGLKLSSHDWPPLSPTAAQYTIDPLEFAGAIWKVTVELAIAIVVWLSDVTVAVMSSPQVEAARSVQMVLGSFQVGLR